MGALLQIADHASGKTYYPGYDGNGNVTVLVNGSNGAVAASFEYSPFGELLRTDAPDATAGDQPFRFSTRYLDFETGLMDYGRRYYSPRLGRFLGRDPIEEVGGANLYGFCGNNGIDRWDVLGMAFGDTHADNPVIPEGFYDVGDGVMAAPFGYSYDPATHTCYEDPNAPTGRRTTLTPNSAGTTNGNDTLLGRVNLFIATVGGQTATNALNTATVAALGAQQGLRDTVSFSGELGVNIIPIIPRSAQYRPHPVAGGWGVSGELGFNNQDLNQPISAGKWGGYGSIGITFTIPISGGKSVGSISAGGGAGPGGQLQVGFDRTGSPTEVKITIGAGFGFEFSGNMGFPKGPNPPPTK